MQASGTKVFECKFKAIETMLPTVEGLLEGDALEDSDFTSKFDKKALALIKTQMAKLEEEVGKCDRAAAVVRWCDAERLEPAREALRRGKAVAVKWGLMTLVGRLAQDSSDMKSYESLVEMRETHLASELIAQRLPKALMAQVTSALEKPSATLKRKRGKSALELGAIDLDAPGPAPLPPAPIEDGLGEPVAEVEEVAAASPRPAKEAKAAAPPRAASEKPARKRKAA